jgi:hypothetical protein
MTRRGVRRWVSASVLALAALAGLRQMAGSLDESRRVWKRSNRLGNESYEAAQDRVFGRDYMESIREIRRRVPESESLFLIDRQRDEQGACYFALHYLAPRRLVLLDLSRKHELTRLGRSGRARQAWVVEVGDSGAPLALARGSDLQPGRRRGR